MKDTTRDAFILSPLSECDRISIIRMIVGCGMMAIILSACNIFAQCNIPVTWESQDLSLAGIKYGFNEYTDPFSTNKYLVSTLRTVEDIKGHYTIDWLGTGADENGHYTDPGLKSGTNRSVYDAQQSQRINPVTGLILSNILTGVMSVVSADTNAFSQHWNMDGCTRTYTNEEIYSSLSGCIIGDAWHNTNTVRSRTYILTDCNTTNVVPDWFLSGPTNYYQSNASMPIVKEVLGSIISIDVTNKVTMEGVSEGWGYSTNRLSDENKTSDVFARVSTMLNQLSYPTDWIPHGVASAKAKLKADHTVVTLTLGIMRYRVKVNTQINHLYRLTTEFHVVQGTNSTPVKKVELFLGNGEEMIRGYGVFPTSKDESAEIVVNGGCYENEVLASGLDTEVVIAESGFTAGSPFTLEDITSAGCVSCGGLSATAGSSSASIDSMHMEFNLGLMEPGVAVGYLAIDTQEMTYWTCRPAGLSLHAVSGQVNRLTNSVTKAVQQYQAPQCLVDIVTNGNYGYYLDLYGHSGYTNILVNGVHPVYSTNRVVRWIIENPDGINATNKILIREVRGNQCVTNLFIHTSTLNTWELISGNGLRKETKSVYFIPDPYYQLYPIRIEVRKVENPQTGKLELCESNVFQWMDLANSLQLVQSTVGIGNEAITKSYDYGTHIVVGSDGSFESYTNDYFGRRLIKASKFTDDWNINESYEYSEIPSDLEPNTPRIIKKCIGTVSIETTRYIINSNVRIEGRQRRIAGDPFTVDGSELLWTTNTYIPEGEPFEHELRSTVYPDGTADVHQYAHDSSNYIKTVMTGAPDFVNIGSHSEITNVVDGIKTVTVKGRFGEVISKTTSDIRSQIVLMRETYSDFDEFSRPRRLTRLDGTYQQTTYDCCGVSSIVESDGKRTDFLYDTLRRPYAEMHYVGSNSFVTLWTEYDALGRVVGQTRLGTAGGTQFVKGFCYDSLGRIRYETNAIMGITSHVYSNGAGRLIHTVSYPDGGNTVTTSYLNGMIDSITGSATVPKRYYYGVYPVWDEFYFYTKEVSLDKNGLETDDYVVHYSDALGRELITEYADQSSAYSFYNDKGQLFNKVDLDGGLTFYGYNSKGEMNTEARRVDLSIQTNNLAQLSSDRITKIVTDVTNDFGTTVRRIRTYVYTTDSTATTELVRTEATSADGTQSWQVIHDSAGCITNVTSTLVVPQIGRYVTKTGPDGTKIQSYYSYGKLKFIKKLNYGGNVIEQRTFGYDQLGRQNEITDLRNGQISLVYNDNDQIFSLTTPAPEVGQVPQTTTALYDNMGRISQVVQPDGSVAHVDYNPSGLIARMYGSNIYPVGYGYDAQGRMRFMTNWTTFNGNAGERITEWQYSSARGFLVKKLYSDNSSIVFDHYPSGKTFSRTWQPVQGGTPIVTTYGYNDAGDLSGIVYSDGTPPVVYSYDRRGRRTGVSHNSISTTLVYNNANQLTGETYSGTGTLSGLSVAVIPDDKLRRHQVNVWYATTNMTDCSLDYDVQSGRLQRVGSGVFSANYSYVGNSPLVEQIVFRQGMVPLLTTDQQFDHLNRPSTLRSASDDGTQSPWTYVSQYNTVNQRTRVTLQDGSFWGYGYDSLGQVKSGKKYFADNAPVPGQQYEYAFDDIGNRISTKTGGDQNGLNLRSATYMVNEVNQYTNRTVPGALDVIGTSVGNGGVAVNGTNTQYRRGDYFRHVLAVNNTATNPAVTMVSVASGTNTVSGKAILPPANQSFLHDYRGNLTNDYVWQYQWDAENRLIQMENVSSPGMASTNRLKLVFEYDWRGRRIRKTVTQLDTSAVILDNKFLYDGWNLIAELNGTNNNVIRSYVWGLDLSGSLQGAGGVGGLLMVKDVSRGTNFVAYDLNGNVMGLVNASTKTISAQYAYGPFGELIRATGPMAKANPFRFSTKYEDDESDLVVYPFRIYSPSMGRWLNQDPIGERGGINLYGFVGNSSINAIDPFGLDPAFSGYIGIFSGLSASQQVAASAAVTPFLATTAATMVPGVGEAMDATVLANPNSRWWELGLAGTSLGLSMMTDGLSPNAGGFLKGGKGCPAAARAADTGTTLYRAVGPSELADIQANGVLRNLGSAEGKYFTTTPEAASSYAKQAVNGFGDPAYTIIQTRVPTSIFDGLTPATVDRGIPAWVIPNNRLPGLTPQVLPSMPIPHL